MYIYIFIISYHIISHGFPGALEKLGLRPRQDAHHWTGIHSFAAGWELTRAPATQELVVKREQQSPEGWMAMYTHTHIYIYIHMYTHK